MSREEAIKILSELHVQCCDADSIFNTLDSASRCMAIDMAIDALSDVHDIYVGRWVSCSERLPEDGTEVFVYLFERKIPYIAWVEDCRWYTEDFEVEKENYPIAWLPLPESYREGQP